jgi:hypothetical protein
MKRTTLLALALLAAGCASPSASPVASPTASGLPASRAASPSGTSVTCSLPTQECGDALRAVEAVPALEADGMPPLAVEVVEMSACRTVAGARKGYDLCAAPSIPGQPSATTGPDALASVTYRNGLGKAFLYVWWWTYASGRGPANAILVAHNP